MAKVLVTGATGFLGTHLVEALVKRGDQVRALARPTSDLGLLDGLEIEICNGLLSDPKSLEYALKEIDVLYHCAARPPLQGTQKQYHEDNAVGTQNLVDVAIHSNLTKLVHVSTVDVYGYVDHNGTDESAPFGETGKFYADSKIRSEESMFEAQAKHQLPVTIVRPCAIYGPYDSNSFPGIVKYLSKPFAPLINGGENLMDLVYVKDVVDALILAAENERSLGAAYNITDGSKRTFLEIIHMIADTVNKHPKFVYTPYSTSYALTSFAHSILMFFGSRLPKHYQPEVVKVMSMDRHFSIEKAKSELGYQPIVELREGLNLTARWYENPEQFMHNARVSLGRREAA